MAMTKMQMQKKEIKIPMRNSQEWVLGRTESGKLAQAVEKAKSDHEEFYFLQYVKLYVSHHSRQLGGIEINLV